MNVRSLSKAQLRAVLEAARAARERDWLMYLVAFNHGLRASEVVGFTRDAISDGFLTIRRLKGSNATTQPLVLSRDPLFSEREALEKFSASLANSNRVFPISRRHYSRLFHRYALQAGLPEHLAFPHVLKHTLAMHSIHAAGIENTRQYLGHKSLSSTGAYLKVSDAEASAAMAKALRRRLIV